MSNRMDLTPTLQGYNEPGKDVEDIVILELRDEIVRNISPNDVGKLMMTRGLLLTGEFETLVIMRTRNSPEVEQNNFLLNCLSKRPAGSFGQFRKILTETKASHLEEKISCNFSFKIYNRQQAGMSTSQLGDIQENWKTKYQKLEAELLCKDDEIQRLQSHIDNLSACIMSFQNDVRPHILQSVVQARLTKVCHPESQRSSFYRESDSSPAVPYESAGPTSLGSDTNPTLFESHSSDDNCTTPVNLKPTSASVILARKTLSGATPLPTTTATYPFKTTSLGAPIKTTILSRRSPAHKDTGMDLMRRKFQQVENNEMPENIVALEQRRTNN